VLIASINLYDLQVSIGAVLPYDLPPTLLRRCFFAYVSSAAFN